MVLTRVKFPLHILRHLETYASAPFFFIIESAIAAEGIGDKNDCESSVGEMIDTLQLSPLKNEINSYCAESDRLGFAFPRIKRSQSYQQRVRTGSFGIYPRSANHSKEPQINQDIPKTRVRKDL